MSKRRSEDPEQWAPDPNQMGFVVVDGSMRPPELTREEWYSRDRQRVLEVKHEQVAAFCRQRQMEAPTLSEWQNASEVATFLIRRRNDHGLAIVSRKVIAEKAFYPDTVAPITVTRSLKLLRDLAIVPASKPCKKATAYVIDLDRADEIKATPLAPLELAPTIASRDASSANLSGSIDESSRSPNDAQMITECSTDDASSIYSLTNSKSTTPVTDDESDWRAVAVEVFACGVRAAKVAIDIARGAKRDSRRPELAPNASPADVRAVVAFWRQNRRSWKDPSAELFQRILMAQPKLPPAEGWSPMLDSEETTLDHERRKAEREATKRRHSREHHEYQRREAEMQRERERDAGALRRMIAEHCPELARRLEREQPLSEPGYQPRPPPEA